MSEERVVSDPAEVFVAETGSEHTFRVLGNVMTVAFLAPDGAGFDEDYPRYVLTSDDGAYRRELTAKDDLTEGDDWLELRFDELLRNRTYTLVCQSGPDVLETVFAGLSYVAIVDRKRPYPFDPDPGSE